MMTEITFIPSGGPVFHFCGGLGVILNPVEKFRTLTIRRRMAKRRTVEPASSLPPVEARLLAAAVSCVIGDRAITISSWFATPERCTASPHARRDPSLKGMIAMTVAELPDMLRFVDAASDDPVFVAHFAGLDDIEPPSPDTLPDAPEIDIGSDAKMIRLRTVPRPSFEIDYANGLTISVQPYIAAHEFDQADTIYRETMPPPCHAPITTSLLDVAIFRTIDNRTRDFRYLTDRFVPDEDRFAGAEPDRGVSCIEVGRLLDVMARIEAIPEEMCDLL